LSIRAGADGGAALKCFADCPTSAIVSAIGLAVGDLLPADRARDNGQPARRRSPARDIVDAATAAAAAARVAIDWAAESERFQGAIDDERVGDLADALGVAPGALLAISVGWVTRADLDRLHAGGKGWQDDPPDGAYSFPERDGSGRIVGSTLRALDGRKGFPRGARRGLIVPETLAASRDPVLIVEGASDVAALLTLGLTAIGRPSNKGGADHLARMLKTRRVIILGENDAKSSGAWPGRDGALAVAERIAGAWSEPIAWALPPAESKDARSWLNTRSAAGLDLNNPDACKDAGRELLAAILQTAREAKPKKRSQSDALVDLAMERYRLGVTRFCLTADLFGICRVNLCAIVR